MGVTLEFAIGDAAAIRKAVEDLDLDRLGDPAVVEVRADMSLHITPEDLDTLSEEFGTASRREAILLSPHLEVLLDEVDRGVLLVDDDWVAYVADVPQAQARSVTERWIARMSSEYADPQIVVTDAAVHAVGELIALCARAKQDQKRLVHLWSL